MLERLNFMLGFLPWVLYVAIAGNTMHSIRASIAVCLASTLFFGYRHLKSGFLLTWGTVIFFSVSLLAVTIFADAWFAKHMGVLAGCSLAFIAWGSVLIGKPFTIQYSREHVPEDLWRSPAFMQKNRVITAMWGGVFLFSAAMALFHLYHPTEHKWVFHLLTAVVIQGGIAFTLWYPKRDAKA